MFILGYFLFFAIRVLGDRYFPDPEVWQFILQTNKWAVKILILAVCAGIGMQIHLSTLLKVGWKAVLAGGAASLFLAGGALIVLYGEQQGYFWESTIALLILLLVSGTLYKISKPATSP